MWKWITPGTLYQLVTLLAGIAVVLLAVAAGGSGRDVGGTAYYAVLCVAAILSAEWITELANVSNNDYRPGWRPTPAWMLAGFFWLALIALGVAAVLG